MGEPTEEVDDMLTTAEAGKLLGYRKDTIRKLCECGAFPQAQRIGHSGWWKIPRTDVTAYRRKSLPRRRTRDDSK